MAAASTSLPWSAKFQTALTKSRSGRLSSSSVTGRPIRLAASCLAERASAACFSVSVRVSSSEIRRSLACLAAAAIPDAMNWACSAAVPLRAAAAAVLTSVHFGSSATRSQISRMKSASVALSRSAPATTSMLAAAAARAWSDRRLASASRRSRTTSRSNAANTPVVMKS